MEKMIGVINDNLRNVINGIKTHREEAEKSLAIIVADIDEKVGIAGQYKQSVEDARAIITSLENEISGFERDLSDLNEKFGAKDFKEILAAGNKEISTKIIEKRSLISDQSRVIADLTEQAHKLKNELLKLKDRRTATEVLLKKSRMLETYYGSRITEIIDFSEANPNTLDEYIADNAHKIMDVKKLEISDIDVKELVDGSVFEEIESISTESVADDIVKEAYSGILEDKDDDENEGTSKYLDLSVTQQLDDIILAASSIIAKEKEEKEAKVVEVKTVKKVDPVKEIFDQIQNIDELTADEEVVEEIEEESEESASINELVNELDAVPEKEEVVEEVSEDTQDNKEDDVNLEDLLFGTPLEEEIPERETHFPLFDEILDKTPALASETEEVKVELRPVEEDLEEQSDEEDYEINIKSLEDTTEMSLEDFTDPLELNKEFDLDSSLEDDDEDDNREYTLDDFLGPKTGDEKSLIDEEDETQELNIIDDLLMDTVNPDELLRQDVVMPDTNESSEQEVQEEVNNNEEAEEGLMVNAPLDINQIKDALFNASTKDFYVALEDCGLNYDRFSENDLIEFEGFFNKQNTIHFIQVLKKHNINIDVIYNSLSVLRDVTPQNLDKIISLLKVTGATSNTISYVFDKLDQVNLSDLERAININSNRQLMEVLYESVPYNGESKLVEILKLNQSDEMKFRNNTTIDEFKMMNLFPEIVMANYNELKKLNIDNLDECIIKHPHRFTYNPDRFLAILDKYDTEDLVRCINKNSAVLDRL